MCLLYVNFNLLVFPGSVIYLIICYLIIQELRGLVRKVQSIQEKGSNSDEEEGKVNSDVVRAEKSLTRFLRDLAKQLHS